MCRGVSPPVSLDEVRCPSRNSCGMSRSAALWLWSNKISKIEGLSNCGEIRELWLQSNKISKITGLGSLVHLQSLGLANNRVSDFKELQRLSTLPSLIEVSFSDVHFGWCPVSVFPRDRTVMIRGRGGGG